MNDPSVEDLKRWHGFMDFFADPTGYVNPIDVLMAEHAHREKEDARAAAIGETPEEAEARRRDVISRTGVNVPDGLVLMEAEAVHRERTASRFWEEECKRHERAHMSADALAELGQDREIPTRVQIVRLKAELARPHVALLKAAIKLLGNRGGRAGPYMNEKWEALRLAILQSEAAK